MRARIASIIVMAILTLPMILSMSAMADDTSRAVDPWVIKSVGLERQAIFDMAVGEVDPLTPGLETVVTGGGGIISQYSADTFEQKSLYTVLKTQHAIDIGDVYSGTPGNEIVTVGTDKMVHLLMRQGDGTWNGRTIWTSVGSLNGVTIGEFNSSHAGLEIAAVGDEALLTVLNEDPSVDGGWATMTMPVMDILITNMMNLAADVLPDSPGDEILIGSFSGHALLAKHDDHGLWNITSIYLGDYAILAFGFGADLVPEITSPEVYIGTFEGKVVMAHHNGTNWTTELIYTDPKANAMYAVVPGDIDPRYPGAELIACGVSNDVHIMHYDNGSWVEETIVDRSGRFQLLYDVKVAEVDSRHPGLEVMIGGFFQEMIEFSYTEPGFELVPMPLAQTVVGGHDATFWLKVNAIGNFDDDITLSTDPGVILSKTKVSIGDLVEAKVSTVAGDIDRQMTSTVRGDSGNLNASAKLMLNIKARATPAIGIEVTPSTQTTAPGFSTTFAITPTVINNWFPNIWYTIKEPGQLAYQFVSDNEFQDKPSILTVTPPSYSDSMTHHLEIIAMATDGTKTYNTSAIVTLIVDARGLPDFTLQVNPEDVMGPYASFLRFDLTLNPLFDFNDEVVISVDGVPEGSVGTFSAKVVDLPAKVQYVLYMGPVNFSEYRILEFTATGGGMTHKAVAVLFHLGTSYSFDFYPKVLPSSQITSPGTTAHYLVHVWGYGDIYEFEVDMGDAPVKATVKPAQSGNPEYRLLEVEVKMNAVPGKYTGTVIARGQWERHAPFEVIVDQANDFPLALEYEDLVCMRDYPYWWTGVEGCDMIMTDLAPAEVRYNWTFMGLRVTDEGFIPDDDLRNSMVWGPDHDRELRKVQVPDDELREARPGYDYYALFIVKPQDKPYPKVKLLKIHIIEQKPILTFEEYDARGIFREGTNMEFSIEVLNIGPVAAQDVKVELFVDGKLIGQRTIDSITPTEGPMVLTFKWKAVGGDHNITFVMGESGLQEMVIPEETTSRETTIYENRFDGPAMSMLLLLVFAGLAYTMRSTIEKDTLPTKSKKRRDNEEE